MADQRETPSRPHLDADRMRIAQEYARERRHLIPLDLALVLGYFAVWWGWLSAPVIDVIQDLTDAFHLQAIAYVGLFAGIAILLDFPLNAYRHTRAVHYGLSVQSWQAWLSDWLKGLGLSAVLGVGVVLILYTFLREFPATWWLWMAAAYLLLTVVLAQLGPVLIAPLFLKFTPYDDEDLTPRLEAMAQEAGTRVQGVFRTNLSQKTTAANAWLSGLGRTRRIVLGDTLLEHYHQDEILAVFAHEMGHHVHRDIWRSIALATAINLLGFYLAGALVAWAVATFHYTGPADLRAFPWLVLAIGLFGVITTPLVNALSRRQERAADTYAHQHGPGPGSFADAMIRLANQNLADPHPPRWQVLWSYSHPPIMDRITRAQRLEADLSGQVS